MATNKIIIVSGERFTVPVETDNEAVRQHLAAQFPDIASATIKTGKETINGEQIDTFEFVKKAGTKGIDLAAMLTRLPPQDPARLHDVPPHISALFDGQLTFADTDDGVVEQAVDRLCSYEGGRPVWQKHKQTEEKLCERIDTVGAVAAVVLPRGW